MVGEERSWNLAAASYPTREGQHEALCYRIYAHGRSCERVREVGLNIVLLFLSWIKSLRNAAGLQVTPKRMFVEEQGILPSNDIDNQHMIAPPCPTT